MIRFSTFIISLILLISCQKEIRYNDADYQSKIVLNAVFSPDNLWEIHLCQTSSIFNSSPDGNNIESAVIRIEDLTDNSEIQFDEIGEGKYKSRGFIPKQGHSYEIFVDTEEHGQAYSSTYVPTVGEISNLDVNIIDFRGQDVFQIDLDITDLPFQENFYVLEIIQDSSINKDVKLFSNTDKEILEDAIAQSAPSSFNPKIKGDMVFLETDFVNEETSDFLSTSLYAVSPPSFDSEGNLIGSSLSQHDIKLKIRAVSEDLYMYLKSITELTNINSSNNEPSNLFSNIENGYGIFGAYTEKIITIE